MNFLDVFIVLFVLFLSWRGARTGFLAGALSLVGVVLGAILGSRLVPAVLDRSDNDLVFGSIITLVSIVAFAVLGDVLARAAGGYLGEKIADTTSEALDRAGGAILGATHPTMQDSGVLTVLNERMPSRLLAQAVSRLDPIPRFQGPEANVADPDAGIVRAPEVQAAVSRLVRVTGVACGMGIEGTGWIAAPDIVVTNAHVVAGEVVTHVQPEGTSIPLPARVVVFDEKNDIAALRVSNLRLSPLSLAEPRDNEPVAILGFPENGPLDIRAGRVADTTRVISNDAYNRGPVERTITSFKGFVRPGNSGGPAVNEEGAVVATVFASRADSDNAGYGVPSTLVQQTVELAQERRNPVTTKECAI